MAVLTIEAARAYARDWDSTDGEMLDYIGFAEEYIKDAVGENVDLSSFRVKLLAGMLVADVDENRGTTAAENNTRRLLVTSTITQLKSGYEDKAGG